MLRNLETFLRGMETSGQVHPRLYGLALKPSLEGWKPSPDRQAGGSAGGP